MEQNQPKARTVTLPSGAILTLYASSFGEAKRLAQAMLVEMKAIKVDSKTEIDVNMYKDLICVGLSSEAVEKALAPCMLRCLYNDSKITEATFEPVANRDDYLMVVMEVVKENVLPFTKSLFSELGTILDPQSLKGLK